MEVALDIVDALRIRYSGEPLREYRHDQLYSLLGELQLRMVLLFDQERHLDEFALEHRVRGVNQVLSAIAQIQPQLARVLSEVIYHG